MFVKTSTRRNRDGSKVTYLQLAHSEWDPVAKASRTKVLYSLGRADELDRAAVERLIASLRKLSSLVRQVGSSVCVSRRWSRSCFVGC